MNARILTPRIQSGLDRPSMVGTVKIGIKHPDKGYPMSLDYFVMDADTGIVEAFKREYGEQPKELTVFFPQDDDKNILRHFFEGRKDKAVFLQGDGLSFNYHEPAKGVGLNSNISFTDFEKAQKWIEEYSAKTGCKVSERLEIFFMIPKIKTVFGRFRFTTGGSKSTISNLLSNIDMIKNASGGRIAGVPFRLTVEKVSTTVADGGQNKAKQFPVVNMYPVLDEESIYQLEQFANIKGMITEEKINATRQIESNVKEPEIVPQVITEPVINKMKVPFVDHEDVDEWHEPITHQEAMQRIQKVLTPIKETQGAMAVGKIMKDNFGTTKWEELEKRGRAELISGLKAIEQSAEPS